MEVLQIKTFDKETCVKIYEAIGASCYEGDCHGLNEAEKVDFVFDDWVSVRKLKAEREYDTFLTENGWYVPVLFVSHIRTIDI